MVLLHLCRGAAWSVGVSVGLGAMKPWVIILALIQIYYVAVSKSTHLVVLVSPSVKLGYYLPTYQAGMF